MDEAQYNVGKRGIEEKIKYVDKMGQSKILITIQKLQRPKTGIPSVAGSVTTAVLNIKTKWILSQIPGITNLATKATLNTKAT